MSTTTDATHPQLDFAALFAKRAEIKLGLDRVRAAAQVLGIDLSRNGRIIVAGTNGKGSTCGYLLALLRSAGFRVGLFSSPHLVHFRERIFVDQASVSDKALESAFAFLRHRLGEDVYAELTFFEVNTLLALHVFQNANLDFEILEVGLGGRLDSTNICTPEIAAVVSIGFDHQEYLGNSLPKIAAEKAGIFKPGGLAYWLEPENLAADAVIREQAGSLGCALICAGESFGFEGESRAWFKDSNAVRSFNLPIWVAQLPYVLKRNWLAAAAMADRLLARRDHCLDLSSLASLPDPRLLPGCPPTLWGRCQDLQVEGQDYILDTGHNPEAVAAFCRDLQRRFGGTKIPGIVSILRDKPVAQLVERYRAVIDPIFVFSIPDPRSLRPEDVSDSEHWFDDFASALAACRSLYPQGPVAICGSVRALGEVASFWGVRL